MGGWFGDLELGAKYGIILGSLVVLVFTAGFIKLLFIRHRARRFQADAKAKAANEEGKTEQIALTQREEEEGDLFGIRALERGFTGGVAQSRPTTPNLANRSTSTLVPSTVNIPFGQKSAASSMLTIDVGNPRGINHSSNGRTSPKGSDVAVDMQLNIPESPIMPRSPDSTQAPSFHRPSPRMGPASGVSGVSIPSGGLGMPFGHEGAVPPRIQVRAPTQVTTVSSRGISAGSDSASFVDGGVTRTASMSSSGSSYYGTSLDHGNSPFYDNRSGSPTSPPRSYQAYNPSIRIDAPGSLASR